MIEFKQILEVVKSSKEYQDFHKDYPSYYLAHGFCQLNKDFELEKEWQIGYYDLDKDNLAVFTTEPIKRQPFEEAFKDGGIIERLNPKDIIDTSKAIETIKDILAKDHSHEIVNTVIMVVQNIEGTQYFNITVVTAAFAMIIIRINANTGEVHSVNKRSVLDLKKDDDVKEA